MVDFNIRIIADPGQAERDVARLRGEMKTAEGGARRLGGALTAALGALGAGAGIVGALRSFSTLEQSLVGVTRTANLSAQELGRLRSQITQLSRTLPFTRNELLGIAQAAGQLGVTGVGNLTLFAETIAKLGTASDIQGEAAATALVRILNVTGEGIDTVDTFASVLVRLGNNFAATESEIVRMATEVSRATTVFGVSAAESAALGAALRSVGVQAELGGSAVGRALQSIDTSIRAGGESIQNLSKVTGIAASDLKQAFERDAVGVFRRFLDGIGRIQAAGGSAAEALEEFDLSGQEILKVLPVLAQQSGILTDALAQARDETENATALNEEFERGQNTLAVQGALLTNTLGEIAEALGGALAPAAIEAAQGLREAVQAALDSEQGQAVIDGLAGAALGLVDAFGVLADNTELLGAALGVILARQVGLLTTAFISLAAGAITQLLPTLRAAVVAFNLMGARAAASAAGLGILRAAMGGLLTVMGGPVGLVVGLGVLAGTFISMSGQAAASTTGLDAVKTKLIELDQRLGVTAESTENLQQKFRALSEAALEQAIVEATIALDEATIAEQNLLQAVGQANAEIGRQASVAGAGVLVPYVAEVASAINGNGDLQEAVLNLVRELENVGDPSIRAGIFNTFQAFQEGGALVEQAEGRLRSLQQALAAAAAAGIADNELSTTTRTGGSGGGGGKPPPKITTGGGSGGGGRRVSFEALVRELKAENDLLRENERVRARITEVQRIEDRLGKALTETQRQRVEALILEQQTITDQQALQSRLDDLSREAELIALTEEQRAVRIEQMRAEEELGRALTDTEAALLQAAVERVEVAREFQRVLEDIAARAEGFDFLGDGAGITGGAGGVDAFVETALAQQAALTALEARLATETAAVQNAIDNQVLAEAEGLARIAKLRQEHEEKVRQVQVRAGAAQLSNASNLFGGLADITRQFAGEQSAAYKTLFAISQAFAIAEAVVNTAVAVTQALASFPPPVSFVLAGVTAAAGAAQIAAIAATTIQGFASGTEFVRGAGGSRQDNVPAMLSVGEAVLNGPAAQRNRGFIGALNAGGTIGRDVGVGGPNVTVINNAPGAVATPYVSRDEVRIMITAQIQEETPDVMAQEMSNANSRSRKSMTQNTTASARRT